MAGGTSLSAAILTSLSAITGKVVAIGPDGTVPDIGYWGSATIVLFGDGGDDGSADATTAAATAAQNAGVHIDTVGVGTAAGTTVTVDGYQIETALDEDTLNGDRQDDRRLVPPGVGRGRTRRHRRARSTCG